MWVTTKHSSSQACTHPRHFRSSSTGSCEVETVRWWPILHIWSDKVL